MSEPTDVMSAGFTLEYTFKRSLGPVLSRFFTALRDRTLLGVRAADGRVLFPPSEYDPTTGEALEELVELSPEGTVTSWTWIDEPREKHPVDRPFAFALVRLDGADTPFLTVVEAPAREAMATGMRVTARFRDTRGQGIRDIAGFVPREEAAS